MFYHLFYPLSEQFGLFNIFRYITFRSFAAFLLAALISIIFGRFFIRYIKKKQFGQVIRNQGPKSHYKKSGTPTFGGIFIFICMLTALVLCGNFNSMTFIYSLIIGASYFFLGYLDDYYKVLRKDPEGISAKFKLLWQFATAFGVLYLAYRQDILDTRIFIPFAKSALFDADWAYILFGAVVIVGSSNAVNLTDGLDGLAIGPIITSAACLGLLSYTAGHVEISNYLYIPYVKGGGELTVLAAAIVGAGVGFLWYNSYPAQIFMGDVGSLPLGGLLGSIAVFTKNEFLFVIIGGVFVIEAVSVIIQVFWYKLKRKRIFKMAPIHHHFELLGWSEPKVIVRFWIFSIMLAILSIATLKMR